MSAVWREATLAWSDQSPFPLDWNGPIERPFDLFPDAAKSQPIIELLKVIVDRHPERIALLDADSSITYSTLWQSVCGWGELISQATRPGDMVGILAPTSIRFPVAMLACFAAGRPFIAIDPHNPSDWIAQVLKDCRPSLLLASSAIDNLALDDAPRVLDLNDTPRASLSWRPARMMPDEAACILFTSGSTGEPKGIVNSQRNLLQRVAQSINAAHINSDDRFLTLASLCTIVGVRDTITALLAGASIFLLDTHTAGANDILRIVRKRRISILFSFPALLRSIVQGAHARVEDHLRLVRVGGDTMLWTDVVLLRNWLSPNAFIQLIYAATEAPMMQWFVNGADCTSEEKIPIGYPLPGNALAIVDNNGAPTPEGEVGELIVRSQYVALEIRSRDGRELDDIQIDPNDPATRIWRTGDLVRRRADGLFDRIGRKDRQVKIRGVRVELDGVEIAIRRHPSVRDVGVIVRTDRGVPRLIAYMAPQPNASHNLMSELREMLRRSVPPSMLPTRFYATPSVPRLPNSKLDTRALQKIDLANVRKEEASRDAPAKTNSTEVNSIEDLVARSWRNILGVAFVADDDDFFELGGDSLRAIALTMELEKTLAREIPFTLINQRPTFAAFCAALKEDRIIEYSPLVVVKPGSGASPLFLIHGAGGSVMELFTLGRNMIWPGAVIGIQARGLDRRHSPHRTVEAMTSEYFAAIKATQPNGPYLLCGFSSGGLIAFELARRLNDGGDKVAFVGLLDALPPRNHFLRLFTWAAYLRTELFQQLRRQFRQRSVAISRARAVAISALWASIVYRPGRYDGEVTIVETGQEFGRSLADRWRRYASKVRCHKIEGRHLDLLNGANAESAARLLTQCLQSAMQRSQRSDLERPTTFVKGFGEFADRKHDSVDSAGWRLTQN